MAKHPESDHVFSTIALAHRWRRATTKAKERQASGSSISTLFCGISAIVTDANDAVVAIAIRDSVYLIDFSVKHISLDGASTAGSDVITEYVMATLEEYEHTTMSKFVGAGIPRNLDHLSKTLCSRLWLHLDIVPMVLNPEQEHTGESFWDVKRLDEQADSMARKCIMFFGPSRVPLLQVGWRGAVQTDAGFHAHLFAIEDMKRTCGPETWSTAMFYADKLRSNKTKIAFFSSTPQGGGVALMRHALLRFAHLLGVDLTWYVPKPSPGVFEITKKFHNTLQGVNDLNLRISQKDKQSVRDWVTDNAERYWLSEGGPLRPTIEGGADIIIVDDPQMLGLVSLIKSIAPTRPVLYRSHIQICTDLIAVSGSPQEDVWTFLSADAQMADMFLSHPIPTFVPFDIPREKVAYLPAATDWLDGLNKPLSMWDRMYYTRIYNSTCRDRGMAELAWPARQYIAQVARFDPSKGISTVIDSYAEFRHRTSDLDGNNIPQLVICGNGSIDDPGASQVYSQTIEYLESTYPHLVKDCSITALEPNDQLLNTIISNAHVILQLSTSEGFEVKVSEALHAGRPVITTRVGGLPLQVKDGVSGYLVDVGDYMAVAAHLQDLFRDRELYETMSNSAASSVSDEVGTVGNALSWFYLASRWTETNGRPALCGNQQWVNDMARADAGTPYTEAEKCLPRCYTEKSIKPPIADEAVQDE